MATCCYSNFELEEHPPWRKSIGSKEDIPSISTMLYQILQYKKRWEELEKKMGTSSENYKHVKKEMFLEFLYQIQVGEKIGIQHRNSFEEVVEDGNSKVILKRGLKRHFDENKENRRTNKCKKSYFVGSIEEKKTLLSHGQVAIRQHLCHKEITCLTRRKSIVCQPP